VPSFRFNNFQSLSGGQITESLYWSLLAAALSLATSIDYIIIFLLQS